MQILAAQPSGGIQHPKRKPSALAAPPSWGSPAFSSAPTSPTGTTIPPALPPGPKSKPGSTPPPPTSDRSPLTSAMTPALTAVDSFAPPGSLTPPGPRSKTGPIPPGFSGRCPSQRLSQTTPIPRGLCLKRFAAATVCLWFPFPIRSSSVNIQHAASPWNSRKAVTVIVSRDRIAAAG